MIGDIPTPSSNQKLLKKNTAGLVALYSDNLKLQTDSFVLYIWHYKIILHCRLRPRILKFSLIYIINIFQVIIVFRKNTKNHCWLQNKLFQTDTIINFNFSFIVEKHLVIVSEIPIIEQNILVNIIFSYTMMKGNMKSITYIRI